MMESMIHKTRPVGNAHPGMSPKTPGLEVKSQSAAVYDVYGNDPRLEFEVRLGGNVEFGRLPYQWAGGCAPLTRRKASGSTNKFITFKSGPIKEKKELC